MRDHTIFEEMLARREELSAPEARVLDEHLQTCATCRQDAAFYTEQDALLREFGAPVSSSKPTADLKQGVADRLAHRRRPVGRKRLAVVALAPMLAMILIVVAVLPGTPSHPVPPNPGLNRPTYNSAKQSAHSAISLRSISSQSLARLGMRLQPPHERPLVGAGAAGHWAQQIWPRSRVLETVLAAVDAPHEPALNGHLCWAVVLGQAVYSRGPGPVHLVLIDAGTGAFVMAASVK